MSGSCIFRRILLLGLSRGIVGVLLRSVGDAELWPNQQHEWKDSGGRTLQESGLRVSFRDTLRHILLQGFLRCVVCLVQCPVGKDELLSKGSGGHILVVAVVSGLRVSVRGSVKYVLLPGWSRGVVAR